MLTACVQTTLVPDLSGKQVTEAKAALTRAGLRVGRVQDFKQFDTTPTVFSQSPAAGERVRRGESVDIVVSYDCYRCRW